MPPWLSHPTVRVLVLAALLVAAVLAAYSNCWRVPFQFDDFDNIVGNEAIRTLIVPAEVDNRLMKRRPVGRWSLWASYATGGLNLANLHLGNVAIHLAATLALFGLVRRTLLLPQFAPRFGPQAELIAFACALLWSLHPLQTQSVTYLIQRLEALMALFFLLTLYCLARSHASHRGWLWQIAAAACCSLSIGTKEVGMMAPLVAVLYDRVFLAPNWIGLLRRRWGMYFAMLPAMVWFVFAMRTVADGTEQVGKGISSWEYFRSQPGVILHYLRLAAWPNVLVLDYNWPIATSWPQIVLPGLVLIALLAASLVLLWKRPPLGFLGLTFFLVLAPTSSLQPILDLCFEHRMYLPLAVPAVLLVLGVVAFLEKQANRARAGQIALALLLLVALALGWRTHRRNQDWQSDLGLWGANVRDNPTSRRAWGNFSKSLLDQGRHAEAIAAARRALAIKDDDHWCHVVLGAALLESQQIDAALAEYRAAERLKPKYHPASLGIAKCYWELKQPAEAEKYFRRSLELEPDSTDAHDGLARVLAERGDDAAAIRHFEFACEKELLDPVFRRNYGNFYVRRRQYPQAIEQYRRALELKPDDPQIHLYLALAYFESGDLPQASKAAVKLLRLRPGSKAGRELLDKIDAAQRGESAEPVAHRDPA
ncbi:MAG: tetratricopeptide repeat protein [Pirellulaceae bacterium]|nr:tetratricopeptide repeat protein [Pirellulaceae bacterium]